MSILLKEQDARSFEVVFDTSMAGLFLAERAFLHAVIASLLLVHNSCLWYFPTGTFSGRKEKENAHAERYSSHYFMQPCTTVA